MSELTDDDLRDLAKTTWDAAPMGALIQEIMVMFGRQLLALAAVPTLAPSGHTAPDFSHESYMARPEALDELTALRSQLAAAQAREARLVAAAEAHLASRERCAQCGQMATRKAARSAIAWCDSHGGPVPLLPDAATAATLAACIEGTR